MPQWYYKCPECGNKDIESEAGRVGPTGKEITFTCSDCGWTGGGIYH